MTYPGSSASRLASFSVEEFRDLFSGTLDPHAHLGSDLDLAFTSQFSLSLPSQTRQSSEIDHDFGPSASFNSSVNGFSHPDNQGSASGHDIDLVPDAYMLRSTPSVSFEDTRRLASSSVPALTLNARPPPKRPVQPTIKKSVSLSRLDVSFAQQGNTYPYPYSQIPNRAAKRGSHHRPTQSTSSASSSFKLPSLVPQWVKHKKGKSTFGFVYLAFLTRP